MRVCFIKAFIGIILIGASVVGLFYWESIGRERWTMEKVVVASKDIKIGTHLDSSYLKTIRIPKENKINYAITEIPNNLTSLGRVIQFIPQNSQISKKFFDKGNGYITDKKSLFVIEREWIASRSSTLRAGDFIKIYSDDGTIDFGSFQAIFVKDENEQDIVDYEDGTIENEVINRGNSLNQISHIEISATLNQYNEIKRFTDLGRQLIIVQQEGTYE